MADEQTPWKSRLRWWLLVALMIVGLVAFLGTRLSRPVPTSWHQGAQPNQVVVDVQVGAAFDIVHSRVVAEDAHTVTVDVIVWEQWGAAPASLKTESTTLTLATALGDRTLRSHDGTRIPRRG